MNIGRRSLFIVLLLVVVLQSVGVAAPASRAQAASVGLELSLPGGLTDWLMDEQAGTIYAISSEANALYFIHMSDMTIEKTVSIGLRPRYLAREGQHLYVALHGESKIQMVDLSTQEVAESITVSGAPTSVAASATSIFYGTEENGVFIYDKVDQTQFSLNEYTYDDVALGYDEPTNTLFVGRLSSYGGLGAYDASTGALKSQDIDDNTEIGGTFNSLKHLFIDEDYVYFGGHQFNKYNVTETTGTYFREKNDYDYFESVILDVTESYVLTTKGVYDKATYRLLDKLESDPIYGLLDSNGRAYIAGGGHWSEPKKTIQQLQLSLAPSPSFNLTTDDYFIAADQPFTDWATSDQLPYLYAIVADTNELIVIDKADRQVVSQAFIGSTPKGIKVWNDKLYINFSGENRILIIGLEEGLPSPTDRTRIVTKLYPVEVFPTHTQKLLYHNKSDLSGISVTSEAYTSVEEAVSNEQEISGARGSRYAFDPDTETLYAADYNELYRYETQSYTLLERTSITYYDNQHLFLSEDRLYVGGLVLDKEQPATQYGRYPESVIYARGNTAFSPTAVYDGADFTPSRDLLIHASKVFLGDDQSVVISTPKRIYVFDSLEEMHEVMAEMHLPMQALFVDEDVQSGSIEGRLYVVVHAIEESLRYNAYFLNESGNKLGPVWMNKLSEPSTEQVLVYNVGKQALPEGAVHIGLYPVISRNYYTEQELDLSLSVPIYDAPNYLPEDFAVTDSNPRADKYAGMATWKPGIAEAPGTRYYLYLINDEETFGEPLAEVEGGQTSYAVTIAERDVADAAFAIGLFTQIDGFDMPFYHPVLLEDKRTPAVPASSIVVSKAGQMDTVVVGGLVSGDIVRVYDAAGYLMQQGDIMDAVKHTITLYFWNVGQPGDKIIVTRQTPNKGESQRTVMTIPAASNGGGNGGGNSGGGNSGGGNQPPINPGNGGGGGGIGGGGVQTPTMPGNGGGLPSVGGSKPIVNNEPTVDETEMATILFKQTDGSEASLTDVPVGYIKHAVSDAAFKRNPVLTVKADEAQRMPQSVFQIAATALAELKRYPEATLVFESRSGKLELPLRSLTDQLTGDTGQMLMVTIGDAPKDYTTRLQGQLDRTSGASIGPLLSFEAKLTSKGRDRLLTEYSDYIGHVIYVETPEAPDAVYAGMTFDPLTATFVPVPMTWDWSDGVLQANLKRQGNSIYAIVQNDVNFGDIDASNPYQDRILALANRMVINGYPDGSFKANAEVTRAEFAAMLNRALGILPKEKATRTFTDVAASAWYANQVYAAVDAGLIQGYPDGTFLPGKNITHQEMLVMLVNALTYSRADQETQGAPVTQLPAGLPSWVLPYYVTAVQQGLLSDEEPFQFQTGKNTERQESAYLLYQLLRVLKFVKE
ncbi:hypothetical protein PA598K_01862 [Paenibacillus sp. 598K]|uniref:S-layer homology domain-containing protein n=1 Tax=Paenibacillus sp. 598K TaxID=1117987 RepID=UPI000FF9DEF2|nr:S-layer homology domain-containing protein [Paenibacillus sp. 598K]GBF73562.1 hypothetical protein PA598K_01862 [Paenibacillus sp. 598K]